MSNLYVKEVFVNETDHYIFNDGDWYETYTDNRSKLFRNMQREYGRCISKIYMDVSVGQFHGAVIRKPKQVGWVFEKKMAYEDNSKKFYIRTVWVEVR